MYILESKGNYTLVINDINTVIMPGKKYELSDSEFNSSSDIKKLLDLLTITSGNDVIKKDDTNNMKTNTTVFVAHSEDDKIVENVFVRQFENNSDSTKTLVKDETVEEIQLEEIKTEEIKIKEEIVETVFEDVKKVEEVVTDSKKQNEKTEKSIKENEEVTDKPKKQKGRPKKNNK